MKTFYLNGAMYAKLEGGDEIDVSPINLGDDVLNPGEFVSKLGEKGRSRFSMQDGFFLRYVGRIGKYVLFGVNQFPPERNFYYCFAYVNQNILFMTGRGLGKDIRIESIEKFSLDQIKDRMRGLAEQGCLF